MEREYITGTMDQNMTETGLRIKLMVKESIHGPMVVDMMENG